MPIFLSNIRRADTQSYDAPAASMPRVRMRRNGLGVAVLASVNGPGAYADHLRQNGRRKAQKWSRRARKAAARLRSRRGSRWGRKAARKDLRRSRRKANKHWQKHARKKALKRLGVWDFYKAGKKHTEKQSKRKAAGTCAETPYGARSEARSESGYCDPSGGACHTKNGRRKAKKWAKRARYYERRYGKRSGAARHARGKSGKHWRKAAMKRARKEYAKLFWSMKTGSGKGSKASSAGGNCAPGGYCLPGAKASKRDDEWDYWNASPGVNLKEYTDAYGKERKLVRRGSDGRFEALTPNGRGGRRGSSRRSRSSGRKSRENTMAKSRRRTRRGRTRVRRGRKSAFRRGKARSRRSRKRSRSRARRTGRGRGRYRRNGDDGGTDEFTPNKRSWRKGKGGRRYWGRKAAARSYGKGSKAWKKFNRRGGGKSARRGRGHRNLGRYGFGLDPTYMFAKIGVEHSGIGPDDQLKALRRLSAPFMPRQKAYKTVTVPVNVPYGPFPGQSKKMKVRVRAKVPVAFGPFVRRSGKRGLSYTYGKGKKAKHIPMWALAGAPSEEFYEKNKLLFLPQIAAIGDARRSAQGKKEKKLAKLQERVAKMMDEPGAYTPNRRGRGRRRKSRGRGKYRLRNRRGQFTRRKSRGRRKSRKSRGRRKGRSRRRSRGKKRSRRYSKNGTRKSRKGRRKPRRRSRGRGKGRSRRSRKGYRRHKRSRGKGRSRRSRRGRGRRRFRRNGAFSANELMASIEPAVKTGLMVGAGLIVHKAAKNVLVMYAFSKVDALSGFATPLASVLAALGGTLLVQAVAPEHAPELAAGMVASSVHDLIGWGMMKAGLTGPAAYLMGLGDIPAQSIRGLGEYVLRGLGMVPMQAAAGYGGYRQAAAGYGGYRQAAAGVGQYELAGYGQYELSGMDSSGGTFDGLRPTNRAAMRALNQADNPVQAAAGLGELYDSGVYGPGHYAEGTEYIPSFLRPLAQQFTQDSLINIGVPEDSVLAAQNSLVEEQDTWIPGQDSVVVNDQGPGGIFSEGASGLSDSRAHPIPTRWS